MATLERIVTTLVKKDTMVPTVLLNALQIVKHVDTLTASALVRRDGWDTIVQKSVHRDILDWTAEITVADTV